MYLCSKAPGTGSRAATSTGCSASTGACGRSSPMSTRCTTPHACAAGSTRWATLCVPRVTVRSACTCAPSRRPVSTSTPDGTSTATTGAPANAVSAASASSRRPGRPPIPKMPSTTTSGWWASATTTVRPPAARSASRPARCIFEERSTASTAAPRRASMAPAHSASPPLSPGPMSSSTLAAYTLPRRSEMATARPVAARCIRTPSGRSAISPASAARTCSTVCALRIRPSYRACATRDPRPGDQSPSRDQDAHRDGDVDRPRTEGVEQRGGLGLTGEVPVVRVQRHVEGVDHRCPGSRDGYRQAVITPTRSQPQPQREVERRPHHQQVFGPKHEELRIREHLTERGCEDALQGQGESPVVGQCRRQRVASPKGPHRSHPGEVTQLQGQRRGGTEIAGAEPEELARDGHTRNGHGEYSRRQPHRGLPVPQTPALRTPEEHEPNGPRREQGEDREVLAAERLEARSRDRQGDRHVRTRG